MLCAHAAHRLVLVGAAFVHWRPSRRPRWQPAGPATSKRSRKVRQHNCSRLSKHLCPKRIPAPAASAHRRVSPPAGRCLLKSRPALSQVTASCQQLTSRQGASALLRARPTAGVLAADVMAFACRWMQYYTTSASWQFYNNATASIVALGTGGNTVGAQYGAPVVIVRPNPSLPPASAKGHARARLLNPPKSILCRDSLSAAEQYHFRAGVSGK